MLGLRVVPEKLISKASTQMFTMSELMIQKLSE